MGAPKCGTTAWVHYLNQHPDISFCEPKEPHYFNSDLPGFRWHKDEASYLSLFSTLADSRYIGESSVMYLYSKVAAARIHEMCPSAKILAFVRRRGNFIASYHQQLLYNCDEDQSDLRDAWNLGSERGSSAPRQCREPKLLDYKSVGLLGKQIARFQNYFGRDQLKVIAFEGWTMTPRETYIEILDFLGLEDDGFSNFGQVNSARRHRIRMLARLSQRPPGRVTKRVLRAIRLLPGFGSWRPSRTIRNLNQAKGYANQTDQALMAEINEFFREDSALLARIMRDSKSET